MQQAATVPDLANGEKPLTLPVTNNYYRILIAEDNEMVLENTALYLKHKGFTIEKARNGAIAIQKAEQNPPDLILMDIQMPILNGLETIRLIRQNPQLATIPIIAVTALAMQGDRAACLASGANDYLSKPVHLQTLYKRIQSYLLA
jgi:CheY-like chemotaxis protein